MFGGKFREQFGDPSADEEHLRVVQPREAVLPQRGGGGHRGGVAAVAELPGADAALQACAHREPDEEPT